MAARLTGQRLVDHYRRHLGTQARDMVREFTLYHGTMPEATSAALAAQLLGRLTTPSETAILARASPPPPRCTESDGPYRPRNPALRHFEQLSNGETAAALMLDKSAASKR